MKKALVILLGVLFANPAYAQWEYGGKAIGYHSYSTDELAVANVGDGATVVVWNSLYYGDLDIFAQYIDSAGYARWGEDPILVYEDDGVKQGDPAVLPDGEGGVFVVWSDWRHTPNEGIALYGQRLDILGNPLWDPEGVRLTADTMSHDIAKLFADGHGGFVAVYRNRYEWSEIDIGAQRVDGSGHILWNYAGIALTRAPASQGYPRTCRASDSTFITCWKDRRNNLDFGSDIYVQSFDLEGNILWDPDGIPAVNWPYDQGYLWEGHDIVEDGTGGAVVVWVDHRHYANNNILYADRISASGQSLWQENGKKLGDELYDGANGCNAFRIDDNFIFRWKAGGLKISYHDSNGDRIWEDIAVLDTLTAMIVYMEEDVFKYMLGYLPPGPNFIRAGGKVDLYGNQFWPNRPFLTTYANREQILTDGFGGMIGVWCPESVFQVYISRIYADGHVGGDTTTAVYDSEIPLPDRAIAIRNYPNPFNSQTMLEIHLPETEYTEIDLYDILGRKVKSIFNGFPAEKKITINLDLSSRDIKSGIYFIEASQATVRAVHRIILIK